MLNCKNNVLIYAKIVYKHEKSQCKKHLSRHSPQTPSGFASLPYFWQKGINSMGGHHATREEWMDLLGYIRQEVGDEKRAHTASAHRTHGRHASALLLGGLHSSMKQTQVKQNSDIIRLWKTNHTMWTKENIFVHLNILLVRLEWKARCRTPGKVPSAERSKFLQKFLFVL